MEKTITELINNEIENLSKIVSGNSKSSFYLERDNNTVSDALNDLKEYITSADSSASSGFNERDHSVLAILFAHRRNIDARYSGRKRLFTRGYKVSLNNATIKMIADVQQLTLRTNENS